jgi:superfamily II DNA/RNA helicase
MLCCLQRELLASGVDLVIATPGRLMEHLHHGTADLGSCKAVVMDEVDVLLGE